MAPLDALTQARIRSLEIAVAWLVGRVLVAQDSDFSDPEFEKVSMGPTYIMDLAEKITEAQEDRDA